MPISSRIVRATMGAPHRRTIYQASLEAHIDQLHNQLLSFELYPVPFEKLTKFSGLNVKTAKVKLSRHGLQKAIFMLIVLISLCMVEYGGWLVPRCCRTQAKKFGTGTFGKH